MWTKKLIISIFSDFRPFSFRLRAKQHEMERKGRQEGIKFMLFQGIKWTTKEGKSSRFEGKLKIFADVFNVKWLSSILHHLQRAGSLTIVVPLSSNYFPHFKQWWCLASRLPNCHSLLHTLESFKQHSRGRRKIPRKTIRSVSKEFVPFIDSQGHPFSVLSKKP